MAISKYAIRDFSVDIDDNDRVVLTIVNPSGIHYTEVLGDFDILATGAEQKVAMGEMMKVAEGHRDFFTKNGFLKGKDGAN